MDNAYAVFFAWLWERKRKKQTKRKEQVEWFDTCKIKFSFHIFSTVETKESMRHRQVAENVMARLHIKQSFLKGYNNISTGMGKLGSEGEKYSVFSELCQWNIFPKTTS